MAHWLSGGSGNPSRMTLVVIRSFRGFSNMLGNHFHLNCVPLNASESFDCVWVVLDKIYQKGSLRIGLGAALFPVLQRAHVRPQIDREKRTREFQVRANTHQFFRGNRGRRLVFHSVRSQRSLARSSVCERFHPFNQFSKEIALGASFSCGFN